MRFKITHPETYTTSAVCYIDILGYSGSVTRLANDVDLTDLFLKMQVGISASLSGSDVQHPKDFESLVFSDTIMISAILKRNNLWRVVSSVSYLQHMLAFLGVFVRGAISIGQHFSKGKVVISPALMRAYSLEKDVARYPRVILDQEIISGEWDVFDEHADDFLGQDYYMGLLSRDADGFYFVDYLKDQAGKAEKEPDGAIFPLRRHKLCILENYRSNRDKPGVVSKMMWLASQHNRVIRTRNVIQRDPDEEEQLIDIEKELNVHD